MKLSDSRLRSLKEPGKHFDGGGLFLHVAENGGRYWRLKYRVAGREKLLALGVYPDVTLKEARERREDARRALARGEDPGEMKRAAKVQAEHEARHPFRAVAEAWLKHQAPGWAPITLERIESAFASHVYPTIGERYIGDIKPREVAAVAKAVEATGAADMAARVFQRVRSVFRYAVVHELIDSNPMLDLKPAELLKPRQVRHRAALSAKELPEYLAKLDAYEGEPTTIAALRLLMLTALRPGELRALRWAWIDTEAAELRIPAEAMKMKAAHVVPLSRQAVALIEAQRKVSGAGELVLPSPFYPGHPLSENTLNSALARLGYKGAHTAHGCRAVFSTIANEAGHRPDVIERQLAHVERNQVRAAYNRSEYLAERRRLLQWWADYLDGARGGNVVPIGAARKGAA
jgi:integrase